MLRRRTPRLEGIRACSIAATACGPAVIVAVLFTASTSLREMDVGEALPSSNCPVCEFSISICVFGCRSRTIP